MTNLMNRFRTFLGPARTRALFALLISTGIASFVLLFVDQPWAVPAQTVMALIFIFGAAVIIGGRMSREQQLRWLSILAPAFGLVVLGVMFFPEQQLFFLGGAAGWIIVGLFIFGRAQGPMQYRVAVKAMRRGEYEAAVEAMDDLIKIEPDFPNHYRFRAEMLRLWGKLGRARRDYEKMVSLSNDDANRAVAYNGLAEVELQRGNYTEALAAAEKAHDLAPGEWVAVYNLGMILDRLQESERATTALHDALNIGVPDARHRLLIQLYLVRAYVRLDDQAKATHHAEQLKQERAGLAEWQKILNSEQAQVLRDVLADDIAAAEAIIAGESAPDVVVS